MVNKDQINAVLKSSFQIKGDYEIQDDGIVNVQGDVSHAIKQSRLYVTFGSVSGDFSSYWKGLKNLKGLPTHIGGTIIITYYNGMPVLRCLVAEKGIRLQATTSNYPTYWKDRQAINQILDKYVGQGRKGALACAAELIRAGYKDSARW